MIFVFILTNNYFFCFLYFLGRAFPWSIRKCCPGFFPLLCSIKRSYRTEPVALVSCIWLRNLWSLINYVILQCAGK